MNFMYILVDCDIFTNELQLATFFTVREMESHVLYVHINVQNFAVHQSIYLEKERIFIYKETFFFFHFYLYFFLFLILKNVLYNKAVFIYFLLT